MAYKFNDWCGPLLGFQRFCNSIHALAKRTYGVHEEGDCPVDFFIIDRTKFEPMHWGLVPYEHKAKTQRDFDEIERALLGNLNTALRAVNVWRRGAPSRAQRIK